MSKKFVYQKPTHSYVATAPCGCVVGLVADVKGLEGETAKEIGAFIKRGYTVTRLIRTSEEFSKILDNFGHHCQPEQAALL